MGWGKNTDIFREESMRCLNPNKIDGLPPVVTMLIVGACTICKNIGQLPPELTLGALSEVPTRTCQRQRKGNNCPANQAPD